MLPKSYIEAYQTWLNALLTLRARLSQSVPEQAQVQESYEKVQVLFNEQVRGLKSEELEPELVYRVQSIETELYRTWRLLGTDFLFWCSSQQGVKANQRLTVVCSRLTQLINYCQVLLAL